MLPETASKELRVAIEAAQAAAAISRQYYRTNVEVTTKADKTPVTQADVECENAIRDIVLAAFPQHGFFGEEGGKTRGDAESLWLVDPIDGTKGFVREYPFFSTQIALMRDRHIVLGVSCGTMFDETVWAERGRGAWLADERLTVSGLTDLAECTVSTGNLQTLATSPAWSSLGDIVAAANRIRGYGDFYHYHLLASGKIEAVIESDVNILDIAALSLIVQEAGGCFTDLYGQAVGLQTRSVLAANAALHARLLPKFSAHSF